MLEKKYKKTDAIVSRKIADELILVPIRQQVADLQNFYALEGEVASRLWELLDEDRTKGQLAAQISREFEISQEQAGTDINAFIEKLSVIKAIEEAR
ncbi:MAG: PqqD family protein [Candidatus Omnitrophica bacterium]|nr:PqqD family protein [Candidatus Omnitrophota bacterium]MBU1924882.1 PqqD family protein [Candidatus Omnitrophota bacterium]